MDDLQKKIIKQIVSLVEEASYLPLTVKQLETKFNIKAAGEFVLLVKALVYLEETDQIMRIKGDRYVSNNSRNIVRGIIRFHVRGFAFVTINTEDSLGEEIFVAPDSCNYALHGDEVLVQLCGNKASGGCREGEVLEVLNRNLKQIVGEYIINPTPSVLPDDKKISSIVLVDNIVESGVAFGHKVVVKIISYPNSENNVITGEIIAILGHKNDPGVDIASIIYNYDLPQAFPEEVIDETKVILDIIPDEEISLRRDLRDLMIITIDGADAKDLDDAISLCVLDNGNYSLSVHIADVSHYITENSVLDKEAFLRGTSIYLIDRVIPMIPHRLSNGICSLHPNVDRLTITCEMEINRDGEVVSSDIFPSVICSKARLTYTEVNQILHDGDGEIINKYKEFTTMLSEMECLANILRKKRIDRGTIDFDFKTAKLIVDKVGNVEDILVYDRQIGDQIIEEFMLSANETVAERFHWLDVPFLYRIHEVPSADKLQRFFEFILHFGLIVRGSQVDVHPRSLQSILNEVNGKPEELVVSKVLLRSMMQAKYSQVSKGHFGLATSFYTHFTSPIRRYPDLIVHRLIRNYLFYGQFDPKIQELWESKLAEIAEHSSQMERRAVMAERDVEEIKKVEYMARSIGSEFTGVISSTASFGFFVQLPNMIEGLVHVRSLRSDYFHFDEKTMSLVGENTRETYRIGDEVNVLVVRASKDDLEIDFALVSKLNSMDEVPVNKRKMLKLKNNNFKIEQNKNGKGGKDNIGFKLGSKRKK